MKADVRDAGNVSEETMEKLKYAGKNEIQINFLKQMEELKNKKSSCE